jgi:hypothetical protein
MSIIFISRDREQLGQFTEQEVRDGLQNGRFLGSDLAWKEGMPEWKPLSTFGLVAPIPPSLAAVSGGLPPENGSWPVWEDANIVGFAGWLKAWWETTISALFSPIVSFSKMRTTGGYGKPLIYAAICAAAGGLLMGLLQAILPAFGTLFSAGADGGAGVAASLCMIPLTLVTTILFTAMFVVASIFVGGAIVHVCLMLFGGAKGGFEATCRAVSYAGGAINALYIVPVLGWVVAFFWGPVIYVIAIKEAHKTTYLAAICAVLLPILFCCGGIIAIFAVFYGVIAATAGIPTN